MLNVINTLYMFAVYTLITIQICLFNYTCLFYHVGLDLLINSIVGEPNSNHVAVALYTIKALGNLHVHVELPSDLNVDNLVTRYGDFQ